MKKCLLHSVFFILVIFGACSSEENEIPNPNNPGTPGEPGIPISDEKRIDVLEQCRAKTEELNGFQKMEDKIQLMSWLMQNPAFQSAGFIPESNAIYAVFTDGRIILFVNTPKTDDLSEGGRKGQAKDKGSPTKSNGRQQELPKSNKVTLYNGMGKYFSDNTLAIERIFSASKTKYAVERKVASVENLKQVSGDAVFYLFTHGGAGAIPNPPPKVDTTFVMSLWTTDAVTLESEKKYKTDLEQKKLAYMFSTFDTDKPVYHYGITSEFVKSYMTFAEHSVIYVDACNSSRTVGSGGTFRNVVMDKAGKKSATYIGWTNETNEFMATRASQFVFDRLLGTNTTGSGSTSIPKEDPIQRPFDLQKIFDDLKGRGFDVCANGATLWYDTRATDEILLTPTIESMEIDEPTGVLQIAGSFGSEKGKVTVDGTEITDILDWTPFAINCKIPETGPGSAGDVIVSVNDRQSNPVSLTLWEIKLNYASDDNGLRMEGVINLRIRADVHPRRTKPGEAPSVPESVDYGPSSGFMFGNSSNATYNIGGQKYARCDVNPCVSYFEETPQAKSGTVPYMKLAVVARSLIGFYNWMADRKTIRIDFLTVNLPDVTSVQYKIRYDCPKSDEETKSDVVTSMNFSIPMHEISDVLRLEIADNYNIRAGTFSRTISRPWNPCNGTGDYKALVTWEGVRPSFPPSVDTTPARLATGTHN